MGELEVIDERIVLGKGFRIYGTVENPLFLAKDVANWIEYTQIRPGTYNVSAMLNKIDDEEKMVSTIMIQGQNREMWFLTEDGLYEVLMQSRKPIAKQFKKKVKEILKSIRKHGMYATDDLLNDPDLMIKAANKIKEEKEGRLKAESQVKELTDKVVKLSIDVNNLEKRTVKGTTLTDISCCTDTPRRLIEDYCFSMGWYSKKNNEVIIHDITLVTATRRNAIEFTSKGAEILIQQFSKNGKLF